MNYRKVAEKVLVQVGKLENNLRRQVAGSGYQLPSTMSAVIPPCWLNLILAALSGAGPTRHAFVGSALMQHRHRRCPQQLIITAHSCTTERWIMVRQCWNQPMQRCNRLDKLLLLRVELCRVHVSVRTSPCFPQGRPYLCIGVRLTGFRPRFAGMEKSSNCGSDRPAAV